MYGRLRPEMFTRGQFVRAASFALERGGAIPEVLMFNVFEKVAGDVFNELTDDRTLLERATGRRAHLAGSGPCLYALVDSEDVARTATSQLQELGRCAFAARAINADRIHSDVL
jgi:4-diphosphocytidyl-2C-methyl-D-erythritol kinase